MNMDLLEAQKQADHAYKKFIEVYNTILLKNYIYKPVVEIVNEEIAFSDSKLIPLTHD